MENCLHALCSFEIVPEAGLLTSSATANCIYSAGKNHAKVAAVAAATTAPSFHERRNDLVLPKDAENNNLSFWRVGIWLISIALDTQKYGGAT